jgi:hypothetical protein
MTHLLVGEHVGAELAFLTLDELDVCLHTVLGKVFGEQVGYVRVRVKTTELVFAEGRREKLFSPRHR